MRRFWKMDYETGWVIGLYVAEGSSGDHQVCWYLGHHETELANRLVAGIGRVLGLRAIVGGKNATAARVVVSNRPAVDFFDQFGHNARLKSMPAWCLAASSEFRRGLLAGLVDGDGNVDGGYTRLTTTSLDLAWQVRLLLWAEGINSSLARRKMPSKRRKIRGRVIRSGESWCVSWRTLSAQRRGSSHVGRRVVGLPVVEKSERPYAGEVWNLSVEEDESYVTLGGVVHNCAAYHVPPPVMGILDKTIKSTLAELREQFTRETLNEYASEMTDEIDAQLIDPAPQWSGLNSGFDMSGNLLPDLEALSTAYKELKRVFTLNELRRMAGLPDLPYEWANQPWMEPGSLPANLAPQGATLNPDAVTDPEDDQPLPGDDEVEEGDEALVEPSTDVSSRRRGHVVSAHPLLQRAILAG
jgi:hypothetical protein